MKTHLTEIEKYNGAMKELARDIADLRYDALAELINEIGEYIKQDAKRDDEKGRRYLASGLYRTYHLCIETAQVLNFIWKHFCEKHMNIKESITPEIALNKTKGSIVKHFGNDKIVKSKYDHWKEDYREENEEDIVVTWEYYNDNYVWCDKCKSYQEGQCMCYTR